MNLDEYGVRFRIAERLSVCQSTVAELLSIEESHPMRIRLMTLQADLEFLEKSWTSLAEACGSPAVEAS